jgi:hypothetical protein
MSGSVTNLPHLLPQINEARRAIYGGDGPGYWVARGAVPQQLVHHIRHIWGTAHQVRSWEPNRGNAEFRVGSPDSTSVDNATTKSRSYHCWFWNAPFDEVTQSVAFEAQQYRNWLEGRPSNYGYWPLGDGRVAQIFIRQDLLGGDIVPAHLDFGDKPPPRGAASIHTPDPSRLQVTTILSQRGVDYTGDGLVYALNDGREVVFEDHEPLEPGDVVFWRHVNMHQVRNVRATEDGAGYMRIIMPMHDLRS